MPSKTKSKTKEPQPQVSRKDVKTKASNPITKSALKMVNVIRGALGYDELLDLPPGAVAMHDDCPIARALDHGERSVGGSSITMKTIKEAKEVTKILEKEGYIVTRYGKQLTISEDMLPAGFKTNPVRQFVSKFDSRQRGFKRYQDKRTERG